MSVNEFRDLSAVLFGLFVALPMAVGGVLVAISSLLLLVLNRVK